MKKHGSISISQYFANKGVLLTGSTGFLAKAVTEKILYSLPDVAQIYLLIRPRVKPDGTRVDPKERVRDEVLRNSAFRRLREKLGEDFELDRVRFRIVAALEDSLFQSELIVSEENFLRLFPDTAGYRFFLLNTPPGKEEATTRVLEDALSDYGFDVQSAPARLAAFHRVENSYLETFRALGALGLLLGTVGLAAVLLRNVLERRRELALLRAVGYRPRHLAAMVLAENLFLLVVGLATGAVCAAVAVAPVAGVRGGHLPVLSLSVLLTLVLAAGMLASLAATAAALGSSVLDGLRSE